MPVDLKDDQYRDSTKLMARMTLHIKYGRKSALAELTDLVRIAPGARVLDVGCGPGWFWTRAAAKFPDDISIVLTDISPGMVEEAFQRVSGIGRWPGVRAEIADVCALPFADKSFDLVLAMHMLYHAPDPDKALAGIARVLRDGGTLVASTNGAANLASLFELGHRVLGGPTADPAASVFGLETGEAIMRQHFRDVEVHRSADVMRITDPADVVAYMTSFPPGDEADDNTRAKLKAAVEAAFAAGGGAITTIRDAGYIIARSPRDQ
jgi:SAM-dependent methyltransferase